MQLLLTVHPRLFSGSSTTHRTHPQRCNLHLVTQSRTGFPRNQELHDSNTCPVYPQPRLTIHSHHGCFGFRHGSCPTTRPRQRTPTCGLHFLEDECCQTKLPSTRQGTVSYHACLSQMESLPPWTTLLDL